MFSSIRELDLCTNITLVGLFQLIFKVVTPPQHCVLICPLISLVAAATAAVHLRGLYKLLLLYSMRPCASLNLSFSSPCTIAYPPFTAWVLSLLVQVVSPSGLGVPRNKFKWIQVLNQLPFLFQNELVQATWEIMRLVCQNMWSAGKCDFKNGLGVLLARFEALFVNQLSVHPVQFSSRNM